MKNELNILCTRPVSGELIEAAALKGIMIDTLSFISTTPIETVEVQHEIESAFILSTTVVFTSMNAVEAVASCLFDRQPDWRIYCIGNTTRQLAKKYFGENRIAGFADDATALAELIVAEEATEELIFFCGNKRRDELPVFLRKNNISVAEIVVYKTFEVLHNISKAYNAVLFFSPSAVESFFASNKTQEQTIFFAIGKTTAAAIKQFTRNRVIIADEPGKENLVKTMLEFFTGE